MNRNHIHPVNSRPTSFRERSDTALGQRLGEALAPSVNTFEIGLGLIVLLGASFFLSSAAAEQLIPLRNGLTLQGIYIEVATMDQNSFSAGADGGIQNRPIWMVDDGLRRSYIHRRGMVSAEPVQIPDLGRHIEFYQPVPEGGNEVGAIGQMLGMTPFNEYGRRRFQVRGPDGSPMVIHQGITELTARYAKVEALKTDRPIRLDMRIATKSIDTPTLLSIFNRRIDQGNPDSRLEVVRFFIESKRYGDAHKELQRILHRFPDRDGLSAQLPALVEQQATQLLEQAELRRESGQPLLAESILQKFPLARVGRVTKLRVQDAMSEINQVRDQGQQLTKQLAELVQQLPQAEQDALAGIQTEIQSMLTAATLPRLSDFTRLGNNNAASPDQRVALAVAGWLLGSGSGEQNLKITLSLIEARDLVLKYLVESSPDKRKALLSELARLEGARPEYIAKMLPLLPPPLAVPPTKTKSPTKDENANLLEAEKDVTPDRPAWLPIDAVADPSVDGMFRVGLDQEAWLAAQVAAQSGPAKTQVPDSYVVQLPPEYDPLRQYPCVIALHAATAPAETQLNWWSGQPTRRFLSATSKPDATGDTPTGEEPAKLADDADAPPPPEPTMRLGNSIRHGFIVIAPRWTRVGQKTFEYTQREHDAVLRCMRSSMRRFAIDADRIFIAGHGAGGTAAWDISASHPDLWAGMITISSEPRKTLLHYHGNSTHVPTYIVMGEKDGRPLRRNGAVYDRYMTYDHDAMIVMMRGRGRDFFHEESDRIFEWMKTNAHRRRKIPESIEVVTMREGDRFFWWLEWDDSLPDTMIDPLLWDADRIKAAKVSATIGANNEIRINQAPANFFTVWFSPSMPVKFGELIPVRYRNRRVDFRFDGKPDVMLEDARTRADRKRPYWGKVQIP